MSTPTTPNTSASAVARAGIFLFWNLKGVPPFWPRECFRRRHVPISRRPIDGFAAWQLPTTLPETGVAKPWPRCGDPV
jgi:hypothetical protein